MLPHIWERNSLGFTNGPQVQPSCTVRGNWLVTYILLLYSPYGFLVPVWSGTPSFFCTCAQFTLLLDLYSVIRLILSFSCFSLSDLTLLALVSLLVSYIPAWSCTSTCFLYSVIRLIVHFSRSSLIQNSFFVPVPLLVSCILLLDSPCSSLIWFFLSVSILLLVSGILLFTSNSPYVFLVPACLIQYFSSVSVPLLVSGILSSASHALSWLPPESVLLSLSPHLPSYLTSAPVSSDPEDKWEFYAKTLLMYSLDNLVSFSLSMPNYLIVKLLFFFSFNTFIISLYCL